MRPKIIEEGAMVIILEALEGGADKEREREIQKTRITVVNDTVKVPGIGIVNMSKMIGIPYGSKFELGRRTFYLMRPTVVDKIETLRRKAQIILPKDSAMIEMYCDIGAGDTVVEAGIGSGALSIALCDRVRPNGRVVSYELREEFAKVARANIEDAGYGTMHEVRIRDITKGIDEKDVDAVVLDMPEPWEAVAHAHSALAPSGCIATYSPTVAQMEMSAKKMWEVGFVEVKPFEVLMRDWYIAEQSTRPSFDMRGHTGFVVVGRKIEK